MSVYTQMPVLSNQDSGRTSVESQKPPASRHRGARRGSSREPKHGYNYDAAELAELVHTSEMVPTISNLEQLMPKTMVDFDDTSTMAPSSAGPSPLIEMLVVEQDPKAWPSLQQADLVQNCPGWTCCDDEDEDAFFELPEPAMSAEEAEALLQNPATWCVVPPAKPKLSEESPKPVRPSFAEVLRSQSQALPPHVSTPVMPSLRTSPLRRRSCTEQHTGAADDSDLDDMDGCHDFQSSRGWTKKDKSSRNYKYQASLAGKVRRRAEQRSQSRFAATDESLD